MMLPSTYGEIVLHLQLIFWLRCIHSIIYSLWRWFRESRFLGMSKEKDGT